MSRTLRFLAVLGIVAAACGACADTFLLYNPKGGYLAGDYRFLADISFRRLLLGHYIGIVAIPFELLGFVLVARAMPSGNWRPIAGSLGLIAMICGICYHATVGAIGLTISRSLKAGHASAAWVQHAKDLAWFSEPLGAVIVVGFALLSLGWAWMVWKDETGYPRWMAFLNPLSIYGLLALLYVVLPVVGRWTLPVGFNLAIGIFLLLSLRWAEPVED